MPAKTHFIQRGIQHTEIDNFLAKELNRAGYNGVDIQKTPLGTRVVIYADRPGIVIGRSGKNVKDLTIGLEEKFKLENPQIEVNELEMPELKARVVANLLAQRLERGDHFRRAANAILRKVMAAGAKGIEIKISGKLSSQRARYQKFKEGVISKAGDPSEMFVDYANVQAYLKPGILGVQVKLMPPDASLPDEVKIRPRQEPIPVKEGLAPYQETQAESRSEAEYQAENILGLPPQEINEAETVDQDLTHKSEEETVDKPED